MVRSKGTELSVFKGREAKLNRAIFHTLTQKSPLTVYEIHKQIKTSRGLKRTKYTNVSRRVKALEEADYLRKAGTRSTQAGSQAMLYELTTRAHVASLLDKIDPDTFTGEADEDALTAELAALIQYLERNEQTHRTEG